MSETRSHLQGVHVLDPSGQYERSLSERALVSEACFLKLFITLEEFLELSFAHYLVGKMSTARWRPSKYAKPPTIEHAQKMLIGSQRYVDWSTPDTVVKFAKLYFVDGEPYKTPLAGAKSHLDSMKTVRNSTAHLSSTTRAALEALYSRWTGTPTNGIVAYDMLMAPEASRGNTFYDASEQYVSAIIGSIANRT
jgi:hypothetical protein